MENENIFASGIFFEKPHENAPDYVKGKVSIKIDEFITFLKANVNEKGYVNLDMKKSKEKGHIYFQLNDWKPTKKKSDDDVPF